ncbi:MAG: DNA-binding transcriptional activator DevR/DosR [Acidimicrobiales bacterium]|nr:MAG: DNA-binding response regulator [Actinomycetota bacterium]MBV6508226.1 DNA-binding transcriptional activator DevR/DosR [Acidimicrobiales bacterium]RIK07299.1 MAG: DNA-binding response regulator [Acidobacteriota bacterium]
MRTRIFVVDDHPLVRRGLKTLLSAQDDMQLVGDSATAAGAVAALTETRADIALLDIRLPDMDGVSLCRQLSEAHPSMSCLMLSSYLDDDLLFNAIKAGAAGYLLKEISDQDLVDGIRRVADGQSLLDPAVTNRVFDKIRRNEERRRLVGSLTRREAEILDLIADGHSNKQIAQATHLSEKTVKNYVSHLLTKLGVESRTQAAIFALESRNEPFAMSA